MSQIRRYSVPCPHITESDTRARHIGRFLKAESADQADVMRSEIGQSNDACKCNYVLQHVHADVLRSTHAG
jgi:hypothetical protein